MNETPFASAQAANAEAKFADWWHRIGRNICAVPTREEYREAMALAAFRVGYMDGCIAGLNHAADVLAERGVAPPCPKEP